MAEGTYERWVIIWFPPDAESRERAFTTPDAALAFLDRNEDASSWNPLMVHRLTVTTEEIVPLP